MHLFKTSPLVALAAVLLASSIQASPVPSSNPVSEYVPLSERIFPEADYIKHEALHKRSSAGYNDWGCRVSAKKPNPIVFVHGLGSNGLENWQYFGPRFALAGYCTFTITYGQYKNIPLLAGLDKMENSAAELSTFVDRVLTQTNSTKVFLVGHSEGSMMPRYYLKYLGGQTKVAKYAAIGSIVYGSSLYNLVPFLTGLGLYDPIKKIVDPLCLSCFQVLQDSPFLKDLNEGGDTVPGVEYHYIVSKYDELVTPYTNGFLKDAATNPLAENIVTQSLCPLNVDGHISQMFSPLAFNSIRAFFDRSLNQNINCLDSVW
ncbi:alpha/beta-hydrolase [Linnemannia elongata AG-77]|uniref:Alpha/beta-hydrolase n=1 Tax=Linnemannia elongata AG-77 TaxID=1314771 RepID=A0A197JS63_9FUNG|nr:alpha/beta-hydrolase [Linnemannia elongata AG-77]